MNAFRFYQFAAAVAFLPATLLPLTADDPATPGPGFSGDRYAALWTKSPFAIATPDAPAATTDYQLVGIAQFDGVSYASLIERQSQEHFVLSSDKPYKNLTLASITRGKDGGDTTAVIMRNGESLNLRLEQASAVPVPSGGVPILPPAGGIAVPGAWAQAPSSNPSVGGMVEPAFIPPHVHIHRPLINVPPPPPQ